MFAGNWPYQKKLLIPSLIFLVAGISAICLQQPLWLLVPFAWVLMPPVVTYVINNTEYIFWLLLILLPLSTEWNITPSLGWDFPDEMLMMLLTGMVLVKMIHQPKWIPRSLSTDTLFAFTLVYFIWIGITCLYATEPLLAVKYLLAKTWYIVPFVVLPQVVLHSQQRIARLGLCLLVPMVLVVVQTIIRHAFYGFTFADVFHTLAPFFRNHVSYSSMLVCLLPIAWCAWKLTPASNPKRKWLLLVMVIFFTGLVFAYSRGAWIALLAGVAGFWVMRKKFMLPMVVMAIVAVIISITWLVTDKHYMQYAPDHDRTVFHTDLGEHLLATVEMKDVSTAERFYRWIAGVKMIADKPVTGFGPNAFYLHYRPYTVSRFETWVSDNPEHSTVHNYFLLVALEQGIIGLVLFCVLYFGMLLRVQSLYHRFQSIIYRMVAATIGMILVMIGVINTLSDMIETDKVGSLFWLCLGMLVLLETKAKEEREALA